MKSFSYERNTTSRGFLRHRNGTTATFDAGEPETVGTTLVAAVNAHGTIVGTYVDVTGALRGFMRGEDGTLSPVNQRSSQMTQPTAINDAGDIVGFYWDAGGTQRGFNRWSSGEFNTIDPPTACFLSPFTVAYIDSQDDFATSCVDSNGFEHGVFESGENGVTVFDYPGSLYTTVTGYRRTAPSREHFSGRVPSMDSLDHRPARSLLSIIRPVA